MFKICSVDGCSKSAEAKGLCPMHRSRLLRNGTLEPIYRDRSGIAQRYPKEYRSWLHLRERCHNKNCKDYDDYGGRGIEVCARWLEKPYGFRNFLNDMGPKPDIGYSIDRIDNDGDYSPENCRWADAKTQSNNRRARKDARFYTHDGETKTLREWSEIIDVPLKRIQQRYWSDTFDKVKLLENKDFRCKI